MRQLSAREEREGERRRETGTGGGRWLAFFLVLRPCRAAASLACARPLLARFFPSFSFAAWRAFLPSSMGRGRAHQRRWRVCRLAGWTSVCFSSRACIWVCAAGRIYDAFCLCVGLGYQSRPVRFLLAR
jgi:hypothetical protein